MILFKKTADLTGWLGNQRISQKMIGFVPTMGALHAGHLSLIGISKKSTGLTVASIFVNPTQFNDPKDFQQYPITLEKDIALLEEAETDVLFLPEAEELYPGGVHNLEKYDLGRLEAILEGKYRPGHFQGVCQVMRRLLEGVGPDHLFMGQKDYQQCMVVQRLLEITGMPAILHRCPIAREPDGLAMSSRNMRLTAEQRENAASIYRSLMILKEGGTKEQALETLEKADFRVDYVEIADAETLEPASGAASDIATRLKPLSPTPRIALIAAFQGEVRLIDNMLL